MSRLLILYRFHTKSDPDNIGAQIRTHPLRRPTGLIKRPYELESARVPHGRSGLGRVPIIIGIDGSASPDDVQMLDMT